MQSRTLFQKSVLTAGIFIALAIASQAMLNPAEMMNSGFGINVTTSSGYNEIRAQYGGFFLALALVCLLSTVNRLPLKTGLSILGLVFGGVLFGRVASLFIDGIGALGTYTPVLKFLFLLDGAGLVFTAIALIL